MFKDLKDPKERLSAFLQADAEANAAKNAAERKAKATRAALEAEMLAQGVDEHQDVCLVEGGLATYRAEIAERQVDSIDAALVRTLCRDDEQFVGLVSVTKKALEAGLGKTAVAAATVQVTKPRSLAVERLRA
jgi:hypothetical protein